MEIREISLPHLYEYISGEDPAFAEVVPITPERAWSQQRNPHAVNGDILLWVALSDEGKVIGFAGSLPGRDILNGTRMGWNTCWWVDPDRGRQAALPLMARFLHSWDFRVAFADMTPHTRLIIGHFNFCHIREVLLKRHLFRLSASKIRSMAGITGSMLFPLILVFSSLFNIIQNFRIWLAFKNKEGVEFESRDRLDDELYTFISAHREHDFSHRSKEEFQWIMDNPWLVNRTDSTQMSAEKYPFSYEVDSYYMEWIVSRRNGTITSVLLISVRDGNMKVSYFYGTDPHDALMALKNKIRSFRNIRTLAFSHPALESDGNSMRAFSIWTRKRVRYIGISKKIMDSLPENLVMQFGDGDSVFT